MVAFFIAGKDAEICKERICIVVLRVLISSWC